MYVINNDSVARDAYRKKGGGGSRWGPYVRQTFANTTIIAYKLNKAQLILNKF